MDDQIHNEDGSAISLSVPMSSVAVPADPNRQAHKASVCTMIELSISCSNLADRDVFSKSDPQCVLFVQEFASKIWKEYGRTEVCWNTLNPEFVTRFQLQYLFEVRQHLRFELHDIDNENQADLTKHDFLGFAECSLAEVVRAKRVERALEGKHAKAGRISITAKDHSTMRNETLTLKFEAKQLRLRKRHAVLQCSKRHRSGAVLQLFSIDQQNSDKPILVLRTEVAVRHRHHTYVWPEFAVQTSRLSDGDRSRHFLVRCVDYSKRSGREELVGEFQTSVEQLVSSSANLQHSGFILSKPGNLVAAQRKDESHTPSTCYVKSVKTEPIYRMIDFSLAGMDIECHFAIDFSASNGHPKNPTSLHYLGAQSEPNPYAQAIQAVGEIMQDYDSDQRFPVYGFGARLAGEITTSNLFFVNGRSDGEACCNGLAEVLNAYYQCLRIVTLHGPTRLTPVIRLVSRVAAKTLTGQIFHILVLLTDDPLMIINYLDGSIDDYRAAKAAIAAASDLPLSIVIIGIGNTANLQHIGGSELSLQHGNVQFVPFRDFVLPGRQTDEVRIHLAKEVLAKLPHQIVSYMSNRHIRPGAWTTQESAV